MKKIMITVIAIIFTIVTKAQNEFTYHPLKYNDTYDSSNAVLIVDKFLSPTDFNVVLVKKNKPENEDVINAYAGFIADSNVYNTFKKRNDSVYDVYINNQNKDIFVVYSPNIDWDHYDFAPQQEGANENFIINDAILGRGITNIKYVKNGSLINYKVANIRHFVNNTGIAFYKKSKPGFGTTIRKFIFHYKFPKPIPIKITADNNLINQKKENPSTNFGIIETSYHPNQKFDTTFDKGNPVLFIFDHFTRFLRDGYNDNLQYKLDSARGWTHTALSYVPSVLLENLSLGKHTLYVKYPSKDADVLEYHFYIAPN